MTAMMMYSLSLSVLHVSRKLRGTAESSLGAVYGHVMCVKKSRVEERERLKRIGVSRSFLNSELHVTYASKCRNSLVAQVCICPITKKNAAAMNRMLE